MLRNILATLAGFVVGSAANMAVIMFNTGVLYPMPPGTDFGNPEAFAAYIATLPVPAFLVVLVAHSAQAGGGALVASRFASTRGPVPAIIIGALTALGSTMGMLQVPAPAWMWLDVPLNLLCAYTGWQLALKSR